MGEADNKQISKNYDRSEGAKCYGEKLNKGKNENCICEWRGMGAILGMEAREDLSGRKPEGGKRTITVCIWETRDP